MSNITEYIISNILGYFEVVRSNGFNKYGYLKAFGYKKKAKFVMANTEYQDISELSLPVIHGYNNCGIVFQGPVTKNKNLTIGSILLLRNIYPDIKIVLSTWQKELNEKEKKILSDNHCYYLENESCPPEDKGKGRKIGHLANQLKSSICGIHLLKQYGVDYVMKIRSDLRIYKYDFLPYFINLLNSFPCGINCMNKRLLCVSFSNNLIYCPFHLSDFIWFGNIDDMAKMYSIQPRSSDDLETIRNKSSESLSKHSRIFHELINHPYEKLLNSDWFSNLKLDFSFYSLFHEEAYIIYKFLLSIGFLTDDLSNPIDIYWDFIKKGIIVVDEADINVYWAKYGYSLLRQSTLFSNSQLTKSRWLDIMLKSD